MISAIIIAKNEEEMIADCLDSLAFCDEIIVVDNNSVDKTPDIAQRMGAKVLKNSSEDFSQKRNAGLSKAGGEWVLYVDADERVTGPLAEKIKELVKNPPPNVSAFKLLRKNYYLGKHEWPKVEKMERLFKKSKLLGWQGSLHESPKIQGEIEEIEGVYLVHFTHRNLEQMLSKTNQWSEIEAQERFVRKHPQMRTWRFVRVMLSSFFNYYIKQKGFKLGTAGLVESIFQSYSAFITYAKLWEMQSKNEN